MHIPTGGIIPAICYSIYESRCMNQYVWLLHIWCNIGWINTCYSSISGATLDESICVTPPYLVQRCMNQYVLLLHIWCNIGWINMCDSSISGATLYESICVTPPYLVHRYSICDSSCVTQVAWLDIWKALIKRNHTKRRARNELFLYIGWHRYLMCDSSCVTQYMRLNIYKALVKRSHTKRLARYVLFLYIGWQRFLICDSSCVTQHICDLIQKKSSCKEESHITSRSRCVIPLYLVATLLDIWFNLCGSIYMTQYMWLNMCDLTCATYMLLNVHDSMYMWLNIYVTQHVWLKLHNSIYVTQYVSQYIWHNRYDSIYVTQHAWLNICDLTCATYTLLYKSDDILRKRPIILSILLTVATPY